MRYCTSVQMILGIAILLITSCDAQISNFIGSPYRTGVNDIPPLSGAVPPVANSGPPVISQFSITNNSFTTNDLTLNFAGDNVEKWCISIGAGDPSSCTWVEGSLPTTFTLPDTVTSRGSVFDTKGYKSIYAWTQNALGEVSPRQTITFNYNTPFPIQSATMLTGNRPLAFDSSGNIYGLDAAYSDYLARVVKMNSSYVVQSTFGNYGTGNGQFNTPMSLTVDSNGNIYVLDGYGSPRIQKFDSQGNFLTNWGSLGAGDGQFGGTAVSILYALPNNDILLGDVANSRVQKFSPTGTFLMKFGSSGAGNGQFAIGTCQTMSLAVDSSGNIFVVDCGNHRVQKFDSSGNFILAFGAAGNGNGQFASGKGPAGIAIDSLNNVWVSDPNNYRIQKFDTSGNYISQIATPGMDAANIGISNNKIFASSTNLFLSYRTYDFSGTELPTIPHYNLGVPGITAEARINDTWVDAAGNVFAVDGKNNKVYKFNSSGVFQMQFGSAGAGDGQFNSPKGIATDSLGNIYVADTGNNRLQKFDSSGNFVAKVTGITYIESLIVDSTDRIYAVTDQIVPGRVYRYTSAGAVITPNGSVSSSGANNMLCAGINSSGNLVTYEENFSDVIERVWNSTTLVQISSRNITLGVIMGFPSNIKGCVMNRTTDDTYFVSWMSDVIGKATSVGTSIDPIKYYSFGLNNNGPLFSPEGISMDSAGYLYSAEIGRIQKIDPATGKAVKQ